MASTMFPSSKIWHSTEYSAMYNAIFLAGISASVFFVLAFGIAFFGHPHEDAFILYIYSDNLAFNGEIAFFEGGPRAEGATDFLWMALIASMSHLGFQPFLSASILNTIGCFVISYLIIFEIYKYNQSFLFALSIALFVPLYSIAQASMGGFSSNLYAAVALVLFFLLYRGLPRQLVWVPLFSILIALFRPDGVIIGVSSTIIGFFLIDNSYKMRYLRNALIAAAVGALYFLWRWLYFDNLLPLPIYVKGDSGHTVAGYSENIKWLKLNIFLIIAALIGLALAPLNVLRFLIASIPAVSLVVVLTFVKQSQNLAFRFHAPASALLILGASIGVAMLLQRVRVSAHGLRWALMTAVIVFGGYHYVLHARLTKDIVQEFTNGDYINFFPYLVRADVPKSARLAITEAGRFAYWLNGEKYDLVGLNTAETARSGASPEYLEGLDPDIVFFHVANTLNYTCQNSTTYCEMSGVRFVKLLSEQSPQHYANVQDRVRRAPLAAYAFLEDSIDEYRIFFVQETIDGRRRDFRHVYAIKIDGAVNIDAFLEKLEASFDPANRASYLKMSCLLGRGVTFCGLLGLPEE